MDKLERLLNLITALLETTRPLTAEELRARVPGYPDNLAAFRRAFERDKDDLREMGIPLVYEPVPGRRPADRRLPHRPQPLLPARPRLRARRAGRAAPGRHRGDASTASRASRGCGSWAASSSRRGRSRPSTAPWPRCRPTRTCPRSTRPAPSAAPRRSPTTTSCARSSRSGSATSAGTGTSPAGTRPATASATSASTASTAPVDDQRARRRSRRAAPAPGCPGDPWQLGEGDEVVARLLVDPDQATWAARQLGDKVPAEARGDGSVVFDVAVTNWPAFRSFVLTFLDHAEVLGPARAARARWSTGCTEVGA